MKLRANWLNGISVATFAVGTLAPTTRIVSDAVLSTEAAFGLLLVAAVCLALAVALHFFAQRELKVLDR